jgi:hypothetical protein
LRLGISAAAPYEKRANCRQHANYCHTESALCAACYCIRIIHILY